MTKHGTKDWKKIKNEAEHDEDLFDAAEAETEQSQEGALEHPSYASLEEKLTLAEQTAHENWEKSVRALAELDNVRRRAERDVTNAHRYGQEKLISSLLPVLDSLEQALQLPENEISTAMKEGLELTMKLFLDALGKQEVQQINPVDLPFNPHEHEAMSMLESADKAPNTVMVVFQKGYKLGDRVIRPARVIVSKAQTGES